MRVAVIGATGTIGGPVVTLLERSGHDVIRASRHLDPAVNLDDPASIKETAAKWGRDETPWPPAVAVADAYQRALEGTMTGVPVFVEGYGPQ